MERVRDGMWRGQSCVVIGGGPSLRTFDWTRLEGHLTIGVNMAFLKNTTLAMIYDYRLMSALANDSRWADYEGVKTWLNSEVPNSCQTYPDVHILKECLDHQSGRPMWSRSLSEGIWRRTNAGASALNLADVLEADPIYLLGFDLKPVGDKVSNWHDHYPDSWHPDSRKLRDYAMDFVCNQDNVRGRVVNLNPQSGLRCFEFGEMEACLPKKEAVDG